MSYDMPCSLFLRRGRGVSQLRNLFGHILWHGDIPGPSSPAFCGWWFCTKWAAAASPMLSSITTNQGAQLPAAIGVHMLPGPALAERLSDGGVSMNGGERCANTAKHFSFYQSGHRPTDVPNISQRERTTSSSLFTISHFHQFCNRSRWPPHKPIHNASRR